MRNTRKPRIHQPNAAGPALWITAAFVMKSTMATKIATMSNEVRTLGRIPPATRSERSSLLPALGDDAMTDSLRRDMPLTGWRMRSGWTRNQPLQRLLAIGSPLLPLLRTSVRDGG